MPWEPTTWVDSQSIISLSLALNAAYFSVTAFADSYAPKIRDQIQKDRNSLEKIELLQSDKKQFKGLFTNLLNDVNLQESKDRVFLSRLRNISVLFFLIGIGFLYHSTFNAHNDVPLWVPVFVLILSLPFLVGVVRIAIFSTIEFQSLERQRISLRNEIDTKILNFMESLAKEQKAQNG